MFTELETQVLRQLADQHIACDDDWYGEIADWGFFPHLETFLTFDEIDMPNKILRGVVSSLDQKNAIKIDEGDPADGIALSISISPDAFYQITGAA
tara:strand:- start:190 stop:477 length:288 start_codon:yes stop_codon:yes gene_type:complete